MADNEEYKSTVIDWNKLNELPEGATIQIDPESDAYLQVAPPPPGRYKVKLNLDDDAVTERKTEAGTLYFSANLRCTIVSDDDVANGAVFYVTLNTLIGRGKSNSTMGTFLAKQGISLGSETTPLKKLKALVQFVLSERLADCSVDWEVRYRDDDRYVTPYASYSRIPEEKDGSKKWKFIFAKKDGTDVEVGARLKLTHWFGANEIGGPSPATNNAPATATISMAQAGNNASIEDLEKELE